MMILVFASLFGIFSFDDNLDASAQESNLVQIKLDKTAYTWTDKVHITITAPLHNLDDNKIDEIGNSDEHSIKIATKGFFS